MRLQDRLNTVDVLFVFGGEVKILSRTKKAAELFKYYSQIQDFSPRVIVTGGVHRDDDKTEACLMNERLIDNGVPAKNIFMEDMAQDSLSNIVYGGRILNELYNTNPLEIAAITDDYHIGRVRGLAKKVWPDNWSVQFMGTGIKGSSIVQLKEYLLTLAMSYDLKDMKDKKGDWNSWDQYLTRMYYPKDSKPPFTFYQLLSTYGSGFMSLIERIS
jgi:uncharacterized SAM-binding protein YcdF (DUF218 family)